MRGIVSAVYRAPLVDVKNEVGYVMLMNLSIDFNDSTLHASVRSPFARRVRLALRENAVRYEEKLRDVWVPNPDFMPINPIHRVPALQLKTGATLVESSLILEAFYRSGARTTDYLSEADYLKGLFWSGMAIGLIEKTIERFLEFLRPADHRDPEFVNDMAMIVDRLLPRLESEIGDRPFICGNRLSQADIDLGCALTYARFRYEKDFLKRFPHTERYLNQLESRPSFAGTQPS